MTLTLAVPFLKGAVARSLPGGAPSLYSFHEGRMYARSPAVLASYPTPVILGTFALGAAEVEGAVDRLRTEPTVGSGDGTIVLGVGRRRSSIDLLEADPPPDAVELDPTWDAVPVGLIDALCAARPFIDESGSWNRGVRLESGRVVAMSGKAAVAVDVPDLAVDGHASLSDDAVGYLTKLGERPDRWRLDPSAASFAFPSGAWVRCQLVAIPWPDGIFDRSMARVPGDLVAGGPGVVSVTEEFRAAFDYAAALGEGEVTVGPDGIVSRSAHGEHRDAAALGVATEQRWTIRALRPVVACASLWRPDATGYARFEADGLRGVVVGQTR